MRRPSCRYQFLSRIFKLRRSIEEMKLSHQHDMLRKSKNLTKRFAVIHHKSNKHNQQRRQSEINKQEDPQVSQPSSSYFRAVGIKVSVLNRPFDEHVKLRKVKRLAVAPDWDLSRIFARCVPESAGYLQVCSRSAERKCWSGQRKGDDLLR